MVEALHAAGFAEMRLFRHEQTVSIYSVCHPTRRPRGRACARPNVNTRWDEAGKHLLAQPVSADHLAGDLGDAVKRASRLRSPAAQDDWLE